MDENLKPANWPLGVAGVVLGGAAGYFLFRWIAAQGFYAIILPGAGVGFGCGLLSRGQSRALGIFCALLAVPAGLLAEWWLYDESLAYFLTHLDQLQPITLILIAVGAALAYWLGTGTVRQPSKPADAQSGQNEHG
jgi:hypothetical protein